MARSCGAKKAGHPDSGNQERGPGRREHALIRDGEAHLQVLAGRSIAPALAGRQFSFAPRARPSLTSSKSISR
jgi:hypothetical protein